MTTKRYATATLKALGDDDEYDFESVLSVPSLDRDGEIIDAKAFEPLPAHIPIDVDHQMSVEKTVASGRPFYDGDVLKFRGRFASTPLGQVVRTLVKEGHIQSMSVAFMSARVEKDADDERTHIRQAELLNAAIVAIPSNRDALITTVKSLVDDVTEAAPEPEVKAFPDADAAAEKSAPTPSAGAIAAAALARVSALDADLILLR